MYLKSIEIQGFKSFANKINFQFHNGITGIVGPNGSGKSNVADAVRWVLGEQRSKQLRGGSMQDVIFAGTELRKPLSYAYVAITLDNADHHLPIDYNEVTIARRLYRSGESEYLINGSVCRLKDVNELFYDTGIGKEGYSIIGQGQIDKILSGKPEERRELFDEAAGIVKFKKRKNTAMKKLEEEKANLVRVTDILSELEKQIGPLERQSEKAKIYLKKKEALKTLDVNCFLLEHERLNKELAQAEEKYQIASAQFAEANVQYENIKSEYDATTQAIEACEVTIEENRNLLSESSVLRGKLEGQINVYKEQIHSAENNEQHFHTRKESVEKEIAAKEAEKADLLKDKDKIDATVADITKVRDEAQANLDAILAQIADVTSQIEAQKNAIIEGLNQRATIKSKLSRFDSVVEQTQIRKAEISSRMLRAKSDEAKQKETIEALEKEFEDISIAIKEMEEAVAAKELDLNEFRKELTACDENLRSTQEQYHKEQSRLEALANMTERYEGYGGAVKCVMEQKDREKGIIGVVADILKTDAKYETAIETALGASIQNIVTDNEDVAKRMIALLKREKAGRATFLPLTSIKNSQEFKNTDCLSETGVIGLADSLVHIDEAYRSVAKSLLGRIVVVDHIDHAVQIARKYKYTIRMVTLEGEMLVPGGAMSGGAFKNNSNLLGRRREMEAIEQNIKVLADRIEEINREIEEKKAARNRFRMEVETMKAELQMKFIEQNTARLNVTAALERKEEALADAGELTQEIQDIEQKLQEISAEKDAVLEELKASEEAERAADALGLKLQAQLLELGVTEEEEADKVKEWDMKVRSFMQTLEFHEQNVNRIQGEIDRFARELEEIEVSIEASRKDVVDKLAAIDELTASIKHSENVLDEAQVKLKEAMAKKELLSGKQKKFFDNREEMAQQISNLDKEVYRLNAQREKLEESVENQINYMWNEYEITLTDALALANPEMTDLSAMKKEIIEIKAEIKKLGDVNVNAIEDYKNLMERYTFLKTQHDDLVEAEKTLEGIIEELDAAMRKQFKEKFADIAREFDKVFKELFGGGKGTLELQEEEDILEAGIRIIAQPPGKKLQNMMQLSGGEKALTAISLLFAIQNLKPSPFCLLDEIEAALDESNVGRYAKYLHKLTKHTQFIVITHRRGTMEEADRLYGITMQEKGVSALVSVNLVEQDLEE
ncbi:MAG: chromosome segregation protein SMC [Lachnospiraceae bacterium]|nr:chromosome segregation protein SMC [Lachnospiraceae bacterium]